MTIVFIGLGSNLKNPPQQIRQALSALKQLPDCHFIGSSSLYRSKALPLPNPSRTDEPQPDFINAVAAIKTTLSPIELLQALHRLEAQQGRDRKNQPRWGGRTLDLDILFYGDYVMNTDILTLPHPEAHKRLFVILPLLELIITRWLAYKTRCLGLGQAFRT